MKARSDTPVVLHVAAEFEQLAVVRAVTETLAILADYPFDDVADIKLAVDEVCSELIAAASTGEELVCAFAVTEADIRITLRSLTGAARVPDHESFGWHVLETLMSSVSVSRDLIDTGEQSTTIELVKRRNNG
ncbi:ATP-binding protein [Rhodococcus sp. NPDC058521]|uniref:ATP-binding protein n=1 Tax=Rhodococcus sp. NPDC058521 TaxID=3346536 RepID=UPI0036535264